MNYNHILSNIKEFQNIDKSVIAKLYSLLIRSLPTLTLFSILITFTLYPILEYKIIVWFVLLTFTISIRVYLYYQFNSNNEKYLFYTWYKYFYITAIMTALVFSSLGYYLIHHVDAYAQLFIVTSLLGVSLGSNSSLSPSVQLNIIYISIIMLPVTITILFLQDMPYNFVIGISLLLYFVAQVAYVNQIYKQNKVYKKLRYEENILHYLFQSSPLAILSYDKYLTLTDRNEQINNLFEDIHENVIGMDLSTLPDKGPIKVLKDALSHGPQSYIGPYKSLSGKDLWIEMTAFPFLKEDNVKGGIAIINDKTKEHNAITKLEHMVQHDSLTGLLNRRGFNNYIEALVKHISHEKYYSILFYLDLNHFKAINDSLGHAVGDQVLLIVSKRLVNALDKDCIVSRLGGDEFIIMIPYIAEDRENASKRANDYSLLINNIFSEPFIIKGMHLYIHASLGIVLIEPNYMNTDEIIRHADLTMYQAKSTNSNIAYYDSSLDKEQKELFLLQHDLAHATQNHQFELFFQPIVTMKDEKLVSAELLIRWDHPTRGLLSPDEFIPLAIKAGLLSKITWWIISSACQHILQWKREGIWKLEYISININPLQLIENQFSNQFFSILEQYGVETADIMLEITERSLIDNFANTQDVINVLRNRGVKCAIDDFGIGYSSLSYLKKLSFHTLKIDREFVKDIVMNPKEIILMNTILEIGRQFNYHIVIEGIETEEQKDVLIQLDNALSYQGYLYSKPMNANEFSAKFLTTN